MENAVTADFTRDCRGCDYLREEPEWVKDKPAYRCVCRGHKRSGWLVGIGRLPPYVPAWCPKMTGKKEI